MGFESDEELNTFLDTYEPSPFTWFAMQAEGREWLELFSSESRASVSTMSLPMP